MPSAEAMDIPWRSELDVTGTAGWRPPPKSSSARISSTASSKSCPRVPSRRQTSIGARFTPSGWSRSTRALDGSWSPARSRASFIPRSPARSRSGSAGARKRPRAGESSASTSRRGSTSSPAVDGAPRFRIEIDEVKKRELDGFSGVVARFLGQYFDELVTQIASGRASRLNQRFNDEIVKRVAVFKEYGVFRGIDYAPSEVVLHFDVTRFRSEGIAGYVFAEAQPGYRPSLSLAPSQGWFALLHDHPGAPDRPNSVSDGHHLPRLRPPCPRCSPALPLAQRARRSLHDCARSARMPAGCGYRPRGIACYIYRDPKPGTVPLYRFYDPVRHQHFYTTHPHAEFAK